MAYFTAAFNTTDYECLQNGNFYSLHNVYVIFSNNGGPNLWINKISVTTQETICHNRNKNVAFRKLL